MTHLVRLHNEFDEELVVCESCFESVNEGVTDDRERFHSPQPETTATFCHRCGGSLLSKQ